MLQQYSFPQFFKKEIIIKDMMNFRGFLQSIILFSSMLILVYTHLSVWSVYGNMLKENILKSIIAHGFTFKHLTGNGYLPAWQSKQTSETIQGEDHENSKECSNMIDIRMCFLKKCFKNPFVPVKGKECRICYGTVSLWQNVKVFLNY